MKFTITRIKKIYQPVNDIISENTGPPHGFRYVVTLISQLRNGYARISLEVGRVIDLELLEKHIVRKWQGAVPVVFRRVLTWLLVRANVQDERVVRGVVLPQRQIGRFSRNYQ